MPPSPQTDTYGGKYDSWHSSINIAASKLHYDNERRGKHCEIAPVCGIGLFGFNRAFRV